MPGTDEATGLPIDAAGNTAPHEVAGVPAHDLLGGDEPEVDTPEVSESQTFEEEVEESDTDTPSEQQEEPADDDLDSLIERYKNDPKELAKALKAAQQLAAKQGTELGKLRSTRQPDPSTEEEPAEEGQESTEPIIEEETPAEPIQAEQPETDEGYLGYDPNGPHSADGWPVTADGQEYQPVDEFGIPFTPDSRWTAYYDELLVAHDGNVAAAQLQWNRDLAAEQNQRQASLNQKVESVRQVQVTNLDRKVQADVTRFKRDLPEAQAKALTDEFRQLAVQGVQATLKQGGIAARGQVHPDLIVTAYDALLFLAWRDGTLQSKIDAMKGNATPAPVANGRRAVQTDRSNGAVNGQRKVSAVSQKVAATGLMTEDEAESLSGDTYEFEG